MTAGHTTVGHGGWPSPLTADTVVAAAVGFGDVRVGATGTWWSEARPSEGGRVVPVRDGIDVLGPPWSARTRVHEYGGGAWWLGPDDTLFLASWSDQRLWRLDPGASEPVPVTPEPGTTHALRYADGVVHPQGDLLVVVCEDHTGDGEPRNEIVAIEASGAGEPVVLVADRDFVAAPRLDPTGTVLCWLAWDHPDLPWDGAELWVGRLGEEGLTDVRHLAGGNGESVVQPEWTADGRLLFCSDRTDAWTLHELLPGPDGLPGGDAVRLPGPDAEVALPAWVFGRSRFAVLADGRVAAAYGAEDGVHFAVVAADRSGWRDVPTDLVTLEAVRTAGPDAVVGVGAGARRESAVVRLDLGGGSTELVRAPRPLPVPEALLAAPRRLRVPSAAGRVAHAWFYPPTNPDVAAPADDLPPLLVLSHGGPTSAANPGLNLAVQFWTSRGFAVVDVDYGGSTGYGRAYRSLLEGSWGVVDVEDCVAVARYLVADGVVDGARLAIRGGSAGGFTTLAALTFTDVFAAGASQYGVADLAALAADTHKFESRYLDRLVGPLPEAAERYRERSPIHHTDRLSCPIILFQGSEDMIVPPAQSRAMADALARKGILHAYVEYPGEQHGFRDATNIAHALRAELFFYRTVFGITAPAGESDRVVELVGGTP